MLTYGTELRENGGALLPRLNPWVSLEGVRPFTENVMGKRLCGNPSPEERFWFHVNKDGPVPAHRPEIGPCWVWTGSVDANGRGRFGWRGRNATTSRIAWLLEHGVMPALFVCHHCDNRACVRASHMFTGTSRDNQLDMWKKGRGNSKLKPDQIREIRARSKRGEPIRSLAITYGIKPCSAYKIVTGQTWRFIL